MVARQRQREYNVWARLATMSAGDNRGSWFIPEVGDEVLVCFGGGDPDWPYVVGSLWNGVDAAPEAISANDDIRSLTSRTGIKITMDDTAGAVKLTLSTPGGQKITLDDGASKVRVEDSGGNSLEMAPSGVTLTAASSLKISARTITIDCGSANVNSAMWTYSGVIQCSTIIASSVVGCSYTPGAGTSGDRRTGRGDATSHRRRPAVAVPPPLWQPPTSARPPAESPSPGSPSWHGLLCGRVPRHPGRRWRSQPRTTSPTAAARHRRRHRSGDPTRRLPAVPAAQPALLPGLRTLVCRRPGIPDHRLLPAENERVFFVLRQVDAAGNERGLVDGLWLPASHGPVLPGEQEHPMHAAPVAAFAPPGTTAANLGMAAGRTSDRQVFFGYVPVATGTPGAADRRPGRGAGTCRRRCPSPPAGGSGPDRADRPGSTAVGRAGRGADLTDRGRTPPMPHCSCCSTCWTGCGTHLPDVRDLIIDGPAARRLGGRRICTR